MTAAEPVQIAPGDPRHKYIDAALPLFAAKGFHGTSISQITAALGLTKQAMLHHFGSKARLYGAVLQVVARRYEAIIDGDEIARRPEAERLAAALDRLRAEMARHPDDTRLLIRELMENTERAAGAGTWYLKPFLDRLTALAMTAPHWRGGDEKSARAGVYLVVGALTYLAISGPTLASMFGPGTPDDMEERIRRQIAQLIAMPPLDRS